MKNLIIVAGGRGVGKTATAKKLFYTLDKCAWLDGDWAWMINPYPGKSDKDKKYSCDTFTRILKGYIECEHVETIIFSWIFYKKYTFDWITKPLEEYNLNVYKFHLVCDETEHKRRIVEREHENNPNNSDIDDSVRYISHEPLCSNVIDTTDMTVNEATHIIIDKIGENTTLKEC